MKTQIIFLCFLFAVSLNAENSIKQFKNWEYRLESNHEKVECTEKNGWIPFQFPGQPHGVKAGSIVWERVELPIIPKEEALRFLSVNQLFQVFLNNKLIYHIGDPTQSDEMTVGNTLHLVRLPVINIPAYLCFRLYARTSNVGLNGSVSIGSGQDHLIDIFQTEIWKLIFIGIFFLIGVVLVTLFILKFGGKGYLSFGLFLIVFSIWSLSQTEVKTFFISNVTVWRFLDILSLLQIPVWIVYFYTQIFGRGPLNISYHFFQIHLAYALVASVLLVFRLVHPEYLLLPLQLSAIFVLIYLIALSFVTAWKGDYEAKLFFSGMGILCVTGMIDFLGAIGLLFWSMPTAIWGAGLLILFTIVILIRRTISGKIFSEKNSNSPEDLQYLFITLQTKYRLTYSEAKICCALQSGSLRSEIIGKLGIEEGTLKNHLRSIYQKTINHEQPNFSVKKDKLQRLIIFLKKMSIEPKW